MSGQDPGIGAGDHNRMQLAGRTILVAGPADGIAARIARAAGERGALVGLATPDRRVTGAGAPLHCSADLDSETGVDRLFDTVADTMAGLDTVIAVVAVEPLGLVHEVSPDQWRQRVAGPLRTVFWLARRTVEEFLGAGVAGRLVLVLTTPAGVDPDEIVVGALLSFTRSFAKEYGRRQLACNLVLAADETDGQHPPGRDRVHPAIEHALFLASRAASFMNGEALAPVPLTGQSAKAEANAGTD